MTTALPSTQWSEITQSWFNQQGFQTGDLNESGQNGDIPLMKATQSEAIAIVEELIHLGANVNCRNHDGNNALWFACHRNNLSLMQCLIAANIDLNNQNDNGATVLMYAASSGKVEAVKLLLSSGANPNLKNLDDFQAIDFASTVDILRLLQHVNPKTGP